jgi:poly(A) polymerase
VRIIRAVRFAAKLSGLGFKFDDKTRAPLAPSLGLLADVPQSRLFDEMLKLLQTGHALASIEQLQSTGLSKGIYPLLDLVVQRAQEPFVRIALQDTDRRVGEGKPVAPSFLLACVLWSDVREGWQKRQKAGVPPFPALQDAVDEVFESRIGDVSGRGKLGADMREIWMMQPRFDKRTGQSPFSLAEQARFRAGFDFLRLRAQVAETDEELAHWWETFSTANETVQRDMVEAVRLEAQRSKTSGVRTGKSSGRGAAKTATQRDGEGEATARARVHRLPPDQLPVDDQGPVAEEGSDAEDAPAKKRRRRRRKPGGRGAGGQDGAGAVD